MTDLGTPVSEPPSDGITSLRFASNSVLLAASWDGSVQVYDGSGTRRTSLIHGAPVLDATFESETIVYSVGLDNSVRSHDVTTGQASAVGAHEEAVRCVEWLKTRGLLASAGWDSRANLWDPRSSPTKGPIAQLTLPDKAYSMSAAADRLVVATKGRHIVIGDLRSLGIPGGPPEQVRESSLKYQTRCVRCFPNGKGYALSSIEGRVAMEYFDPSEEVQARKYAFKCHRRQVDGKDMVYPVNAIAFNVRFGTFATGGSDGAVNLWDGENRKRLHQISGYPTSISALAFTEDASMLAVAASYCYEEGEKEHPADSIFLRPVADVEVMPRIKQPAGAV